ncbi:SDR family oxidoreductase [Aliidiomarina quisquiliarum]|uniref:SDR family oxidoreductase n=1 Tax=Aliidiomarina quisquiliarum TaxID=2938947 RepID=UPI00208F6E83|nr:SDR family oxidoreductase [Aliidiomarina quisquiliarum]MCO4321787.1 SDR family oxidoreductase [Aliidiomarina quisquiliarum]
MTKQVLITGANRGIGLAFTSQYAAAGYQVFAVCRAASAELRALSKVTVIEGIDVTDPNAATLISQSLGNTTLDILVQNAGILYRDNINDAPAADIAKQFEVNALAPLQLTLGLLKHLTAGSKLALITSRMGSLADNGSGGYYGYRMSKAALNAAGVSLACDLKPKQIAVALLHPGFVQTDMVNNAGDISADEAAKRLRQRIEELTLTNSGTFWHSNGDVLPW